MTDSGQNERDKLLDQLKVVIDQRNALAEILGIEPEWTDEDLIPRPHVPQYAKLLRENDRLRKLIESAPHELYADGTACAAAYGEEDAVCTCWKADAL